MKRSDVDEDGTGEGEEGALTTMVGESMLLGRRRRRRSRSRSRHGAPHTPTSQADPLASSPLHNLTVPRPAVQFIL